MYTLVNAHAPTNIDNKKNPIKVQTFWEELEDTIQKIPKENIIILLGDFNAQLGKERKYKNIIGQYPAHKRTNTNVIRLVELCQVFNLKIMTTHFKKHPKKMKTWKAPNQLLGEFQIDHIAISRREFKTIQNIKVQKGAKIDSDHYLVKSKIKFIPNSVKNNKKPTRRNFETNNIDADTKNIFKSKLQGETWEKMKTQIMKAAEESLPNKIKRKNIWWNDKCNEALDNRQTLWQKFKSSPTQINLERFREGRKIASYTIRNEKRLFEKLSLQQIQVHYTQHKSKDYYQSSKRHLNGYEPPSLNFRDKSGKLGTND